MLTGRPAHFLAPENMRIDANVFVRCIRRFPADFLIFTHRKQPIDHFCRFAKCPHTQSYNNDLNIHK